MKSFNVLCVDDDAVVREVARAALERAGYTVLVAADGAEAAAVLESGPSVDLVLLDWILPGLSGAELVLRLRQIRPEVTILLTSGYSHVAVLPLMSQGQVAGFLEKPFTPKELAQRVARALRPAVGAAAVLRATQRLS